MIVFLSKPSDSVETKQTSGTSRSRQHFRNNGNDVYTEQTVHNALASVDVERVFGEIFAETYCYAFLKSKITKPLNEKIVNLILRRVLGQSVFEWHPSLNDAGRDEPQDAHRERKFDTPLDFTSSMRSDVEAEVRFPQSGIKDGTCSTHNSPQNCCCPVQYLHSIHASQLILSQCLRGFWH